MKKLIESLSEINMRKNEGYILVSQKDIFVPIIQVTLSITKRSFYALPLLDEIVLRLIDTGVYDIDNLANILGIGRKLLDVTLADLSVKDIIYCTKNKARLLNKGKLALKELKTIKRSKDVIKNIYLDPLNKNIIEDYHDYKFVSKVDFYDNDKKLDVEFEVSNIEIFKENNDSVNRVFIAEMDYYNDKTKSDKDELLSIDSIENYYPKFVRIPINIYLSGSGIDIDILATSKGNDNLLSLYKDEIIRQIREKKIFTNTFVKYRLKNGFPLIPLQENERLNEYFTKYKNGKINISSLEQIIDSEILIDRKVSKAEFYLLMQYLIGNCEAICINIYDLYEWSRSESRSKILSMMPQNKLHQINYCECYDLEKSISFIRKTLQKFTKTQLNKKNVNCHFSIIFDNKTELVIQLSDITIIDENTHIYKEDYFLRTSSET